MGLEPCDSRSVARILLSVNSWYVTPCDCCGSTGVVSCATNYLYSATLMIFYCPFVKQTISRRPFSKSITLCHALPRTACYCVWRWTIGGLGMIANWREIILLWCDHSCFQYIMWRLFSCSCRHEMMKSLTSSLGKKPIVPMFEED